MNDELININTTELYFILSVVLSGAEYKLEFAWNEQNKYWTISLYTESEEPIFQGRKLVLDCNLFAFCSHDNLPDGQLYAIDSTESKDEISELDLGNNRILIVYIPNETI